MKAFKNAAEVAAAAVNGLQAKNELQESLEHFDDDKSAEVQELFNAFSEDADVGFPVLSREELLAMSYDYSVAPPPLNYRLKIGGVDVLPVGGVAFVTGQAKACKSQWLGIITAVMATGCRFGDVERGTPLQGNVLWFDTEQSEFHIDKNITRMYKIAGIEGRGSLDSFGDNGMIFFPIAQYDKQVRTSIITHAILEFGAKLVIVDGVRDLMRDVNDNKETSYLKTWWNKLACKFPECNFIYVLHENPGTNKMRGNIGTEAANFGHTTFICRLKEDCGRYYEVTSICRDKDMPPFRFRYGDDGFLLPVAPLKAWYEFLDEVTPQFGEVEDISSIVEQVHNALKNCDCVAPKKREDVRAALLKRRIIVKDKYSNLWKRA